MQNSIPADYDKDSSVFESSFGTFFHGHSKNNQGERVAVLELNVRLAESAPFWNELEALRSFRSESYQQLLDTVPERGWIVLEPFETSFADIYRQRPVPQGVARSILFEMLALLTAFEEHSIVHGDIRPEMLFERRLSPGGAGHRDHSLILAFSPMTCRNASLVRDRRRLKYAAPEVFLTGNRVGADNTPIFTPEADLYSLGFTVMELLVGPGFDGFFSSFGHDDASRWGVWLRDPRTTPIPLAEMIPGIEPDLERVLLSMLAKDPDRRARHAANLALQLDFEKGAPIPGHVAVENTEITLDQLPEELITLDGRELEQNPWIRYDDEPENDASNRPDSFSSFLTPYIAWPLCAAIFVAFIYLASFVTAPARFRLDPVPGVVRLGVEQSDGSFRDVPCDAEGYFRFRPGNYRFSFSSGGLSILTKELKLNAGGIFSSGAEVFDFDRFAPRLVLSSPRTETIPFINGRKAALTNKTVRLPAGRYDILLLAGRDLSDPVSVELPAQETFQIADFPWRFRDGNRSQYETALSEFFEALYSLDPSAWDIYASGKKTELIDFFYQAFCVPVAVLEQVDDDTAESPEDDSFERRLFLLKEKIRMQLQSSILQLESTGSRDPGAWMQLYRATSHWENASVKDWQFYRVRSLCLLHAGQWSAAKTELQRGLELSPGRATLRFEHGLVQARLGNYDEARQEIADTMQRDATETRRGRVFLAAIDVREIDARFAELGRETIDTLLQNALQQIGETDGDSPEAEVLFLRSQVYTGLGREADSENDWREFERLMKPENRSYLIEKELERDRWKEMFRDRNETVQ